MFIERFNDIEYSIVGNYTPEMLSPWANALSKHMYCPRTLVTITVATDMAAKVVSRKSAPK